MGVRPNEGSGQCDKPALAAALRDGDASAIQRLITESSEEASDLLTASQALDVATQRLTWALVADEVETVWPAGSAVPEVLITAPSQSAIRLIIIVVGEGGQDGRQVVLNVEPVLGGELRDVEADDSAQLPERRVKDPFRRSALLAPDVASSPRVQAVQR